MGRRTTSVMPAGQLVALIPQCAGCGRRWWPLETERWQAYPTDDERPELAFYCPECAELEFGDD